MAKKKKVSHEAQYVKNMLKYGNPYGPMPKPVDMRVQPVRKFVVPSGVQQQNVLAEPVQGVPAETVTGGADNAFGGVSQNDLMAGSPRMPAPMPSSQQQPMQGGTGGMFDNLSKVIKVAKYGKKIYDKVSPLLSTSAAPVAGAEIGNVGALGVLNETGGLGYGQAVAPAADYFSAAPAATGVGEAAIPAGGSALAGTTANAAAQEAIASGALSSAPEAASGAAPAAGMSALGPLGAMAAAATMKYWTPSIMNPILNAFGRDTSPHPRPPDAAQIAKDWAKGKDKSVGYYVTPDQINDVTVPITPESGKQAALNAISSYLYGGTLLGGSGTADAGMYKYRQMSPEELQLAIKNGELDRLEQGSADRRANVLQYR